MVDRRNPGEKLASAKSRGLMRATDYVKLSSLASIKSVAAPLTLDGSGSLDIQASSPTQEGSMSAADHTKLSSLAGIKAVAAPLTLDGSGNLDIQASSTTQEGSMSAADKAVLDALNTSGSITATLLDYQAATDVSAGGIFTANTWTTLVPVSFNKESAGSYLLIAVTCGCDFGFAATSNDIASRVLIDGVALYGRGKAFLPPNQHGNPFAGLGMLRSAGLTAGTHTVAVQIRCTVDSPLYCQPASNVDNHALRIVVLEVKK